MITENKKSTTLTTIFMFQVEGQTKVMVTYPDFLKELSQLISSNSKRTIANYLMWRWAESWLYLTEYSVRQQRRRLVALLTNDSPSDSDDCLVHTTGIFSQAAMDR